MLELCWKQSSLDPTPLFPYSLIPLFPYCLHFHYRAVFNS